MSGTIIPWFFSLATAVWFGLMARKAGRSKFQWALIGAMFGLVTATFIWGLCHATSIPLNNADLTRFHLEWGAATAVIIGVLGWLFTMGLHRHHRILWKKAKGALPASAESAASSRAATTTAAAKPTASRS